MIIKQVIKPNFSNFFASYKCQFLTDELPDGVLLVPELADLQGGGDCPHQLRPQPALLTPGEIQVIWSYVIFVPRLVAAKCRSRPI